MKADKTFKSIFIRTGCMFLLFYVVMMSIVTVAYYKIKLNKNNSQISLMVNNLNSSIIENINDYEYSNAIENAEEYDKDKINLMTELRRSMTYSLFWASQKNYSKAYLYDNKGNLLAKSGEYLFISEDMPTNSSRVWNRYRYIDLEKNFSKNELIELYKMQEEESQDQTQTMKKTESDEFIDYWLGAKTGNMYVNESELIPKNIYIYAMKWKEESKDMYGPISRWGVKNYSFDIENAEKLKIYDKEVDYPLNISSNMASKFRNSDEKFVKVESNAFYDKLFKRYSQVKEPSGHELVKQADKNGNLFLYNKNKKFFKIKDETVNTLRLNGKTYYTAVESLYYPLEDIFPQLLFLYISVFIIIGILTIILSKGLYKIYEKQIQLEKNRRELTSSIAHELKTPLGIIKAYSESIKENISERKRDYYLDVIIDETDKMDKLVLEMLDLSKLESRAYELKKEAFCINELFSKILKKNEKLLNDKNIKINYKSDEIYEIEGDYFRLEQVIDNLLSNAMNHAKEKINITIENRVVTIENDGEHISEDKINLIWDMFYKEDESRERSERRSGIGLAIVKNILELHNMEFGALNTEFGVKFWFKI